MGLVATARTMPSSTKIKRGIGLLLLGVLAWAITWALVVAANAAATSANPIGWVALIAALALFLAALAFLCAGVALLLWGLLRD
jgi:hypothetical protein